MRKVFLLGGILLSTLLGWFAVGNGESDGSGGQ